MEEEVNTSEHTDSTKPVESTTTEKQSERTIEKSPSINTTPVVKPAHATSTPVPFKSPMFFQALLNKAGGEGTVTLNIRSDVLRL